MTVTAEMGEIIALAGEGGETIEARLLRAARRLGIGFARARAYRYGLVRAVPAEEADRLRAIRAHLLAERMARLDWERTNIAQALAALEDTHAQMAGRSGVLDGAPLHGDQPGLAGARAPVADARAALDVTARR